MRQRCMAVVFLSGVALNGHAQSSVTLYGRIDNGIRYESGLPTGHLFTASSGDWGCSWFGLRGTEDLGGGTRAIFNLEGQLDTMTGASEGALMTSGETTLTSPSSAPYSWYG